MRLIGLDPGLRLTGWGVIEVDGNRLRHVAHGVVRVDPSGVLADRLRALYDGVAAIVADQRPAEAAVEGDDHPEFGQDDLSMLTAEKLEYRR